MPVAHANEDDPVIKPVILAGLLLLTAWTVDAAGPMSGDGPGCNDKARASELAGLEDFDPRFISIWAEGMQDGSCRGYSVGQEVTVDDRADGLACIRAEVDETCFWIREDLAPE